MTNHSIGENIKAIRVKRNMSQAELANKLSLSRRHIYSIEAENSFSSIKILTDIAQILDVPLDLLFKDCGKKFLIFTIDDYLNLINKEHTRDILSDLLEIMED